MTTLLTKCNKCGQETSIDVDFKAAYGEQATCTKCCHAYAVYEVRVMIHSQDRKNKMRLADKPDAKVVDLTPAANLAQDLAVSFQEKYGHDWERQLRLSGFDAIRKIADGDYFHVPFMPARYREEFKGKVYLRVASVF